MIFNLTKYFRCVRNLCHRILVFGADERAFCSSRSGLRENHSVPESHDLMVSGARGGTEECHRTLRPDIHSGESPGRRSDRAAGI